MIWLLAVSSWYSDRQETADGKPRHCPLMVINTVNHSPRTSYAAFAVETLRPADIYVMR